MVYSDHIKIKRGCILLIACEFVSDMELCIHGVMERSPSLGAIDRFAATHSYEWLQQESYIAVSTV